ncbi:MAG TPA: histidine kinase, partial [Burkholderiaceae bacterium]|nr:histidine kinase [Burkholderiaceae bacterium]
MHQVTPAQHPDGGMDRSTAEFRHVLEKLPTAAYTCDADGLITFFNRHAVALWGREPKLHHVDDRFCGSFKLYAPDGSPIPHAQCWMALALRDNAEYDGHEIVIERPDGS